MTNKIYKLTIDVPATLNKVKSLLMALDKSLGQMFRIEKCWISVPALDAIAATDSVGFQLSKLSQNENAALYDIDSEYEIFTKIFDFHLGEAALTNLSDPNIEVEIPGIAGTLLNCSEKNYLNSLCLGQAAATASMHVKILGQYVRTDVDDWNFNKF